MTRTSPRLAPLTLLAQLVALAVVVATTGCGGGAPSITFRVTNGACASGCANPLYTLTVLRPGAGFPCKLVQTQTSSKRPALESLQLADGDTVTVVVSLSCPANPSCAVCYADQQLTVADGASYDLSLTLTALCIVPELANPLIGNCP